MPTVTVDCSEQFIPLCVVSCGAAGSSRAIRTEIQILMSVSMSCSVSLAYY